MGCHSSVPAKKPAAKPVGSQLGATLLQNPVPRFADKSTSDLPAGAIAASPVSAIWGSPPSVSSRLQTSRQQPEGATDHGAGSDMSLDGASSFANSSSSGSHPFTQEMSIKEILESLAKANQGSEQDAPRLLVVDVGPFSLRSSGKGKRAPLAETSGSGAVAGENYFCCCYPCQNTDRVIEVKVQSTSL